MSCSLTGSSVLGISQARIADSFTPGPPGTSVARNLPANQEMQETRVGSLNWKDPLEEEMAIHSSILAWRIPWTEEPGGLQSLGSQRDRQD